MRGRGRFAVVSGEGDFALLQPPGCVGEELVNVLALKVTDRP